MKDTAYDVFISYSTKDKTITDALCHYLEEQKIRCWIAPRDIRPGQVYADAIDQAINEVKIFVLVCSNDSLQSQWVQMETNLAVSDGKIIIPFKIKNCSLEGTGMKLYLNSRHWIDAVPQPEEAFGDLAAAIIAFLGTRASDSGEKSPVPVEKSPTPVEKPPTPVEKASTPVEKPPVSVEKTPDSVERTPDSAERPSLEPQYEFRGTAFSKAQILRMAEFQNWLFGCTLVLVLLCIFAIFDLARSGGGRYYAALSFILPLPSLVFFIIARMLQNDPILDTILLSVFTLFPFLHFCSIPALLLYELSRSRKILHAAGLKTFGGWIPRSEIRKFAEGSDSQTER